MGFDQYHEPAAELSAETRTFARMIASLTEEAEAIGWYEQRISVEPDEQARAIMGNAQQEEFKHFAMDLEFLTRRSPNGESRFRRPSSRKATLSRPVSEPRRLKEKRANRIGGPAVGPPPGRQFTSKALPR